MCSEIDRFSSFLKTRIMSDDQNQKKSHDENEQQPPKDEARTPSENQEPAPGLTQTPPQEEKGDREEKSPQLDEKEECKNNSTVPSIESKEKRDAEEEKEEEEDQEEEEENDGFKTPTSSRHRIPVPTECPPAPKKPWPPSRNGSKRKGPSGASRSLQFDDSSEVESFFRTMPDEDIVEQPETKKPRRDEDEE